MRRMSVCLMCYNMGFVLTADNRRLLGERKQQPLIFLCWSGISPLQSLVSTHTHTKERGREHREGEGLPLWTLRTQTLTLVR